MVDTCPHVLHQSKVREISAAETQVRQLMCSVHLRLFRCVINTQKRLLMDCAAEQLRSVVIIRSVQSAAASGQQRH